MMEQNRAAIFTLSGIVPFLTGIYLLIGIRPSTLNHKTSLSIQDESMVRREMKKLDNALSRKISADTFQYVGNFETPFRMTGDNGQKKAPKVNLPVRPRLLLKGILQKNVPLAIIEDEQGETFIEGVGKVIHGQEIVNISNNRVTLKDSRGHYEIMVEEN
jgi:hypothetical protein